MISFLYSVGAVVGAVSMFNSPTEHVRMQAIIGFFGFSILMWLKGIHDKVGK